jgi:hypothetical protein
MAQHRVQDLWQPGRWGTQTHARMACGLRTSVAIKVSFSGCFPVERHTDSFTLQPGRLLLKFPWYQVRVNLVPPSNCFFNKWGLEKQAVSRWFLLQRGNSCGDWDQQRHNCRLGHCCLQAPYSGRPTTSTFLAGSLSQNPQHIPVGSLFPSSINLRKERFRAGSPLVSAQPSRELCFVASYCRHITAGSPAAGFDPASREYAAPRAPLTISILQLPWPMSGTTKTGQCPL